MGGVLATILGLVMVAACCWEDRDGISLIIDGIRRE